jgi:hypothetical protein
MKAPPIIPRVLVGLAVAIALVAAPSAMAQPVLVEDFNDNDLDQELWLQIEEGGARIRETEHRLEFSTNGQAGLLASSGTTGRSPPAAVTADDLVNVILDWGTAGTEHGGDVDDDGLVGADDLLEVILAWGPCA